MSIYLLEGLFLFRSPLQGALTRSCCGFKQRLGNFRETQYPDPAESSSPKELMDFFLSVQLRYGTDGLLPLVSKHLMPFCDDRSQVFDLLSAELSLFSMTPCTRWWRIEPIGFWCLSCSPLGWGWLATGHPCTGVGCSLKFLQERQQGLHSGFHQTG